MSMKYLLGIDNGGTVSKAALFDLSGNQIMKKSVQVPMLTPKAGHTERPMERIKAANLELIKSVVSECDGEIVAVGLTGHGKGLYVLGENGEFIHNGIGSTDSRALSYEIMWNSDGTAEKVYELTAQKIMACQPVAILRWLKDNEPETYEKIETVFSCKDAVRYFLTGDIFAEYTDVSGTNLMNLRTRDYDKNLLSYFGIEEVFSALPPVKSANEICGKISKECAALTGLKEGTPVSGGMFDIDACAVAMGNINPDDMCVIAGTWSINEYVSERIIDDKTVSMNSVFCDPRYYLAEESSPCSCGNLEWIKALLREHSYKELDEMVENIAPETSNVYYLPFIYASNEHPFAKGTLVGLDASHGVGEIARAVFEGVAFAHKTHIDALIKSRKNPPEKIRLAGGIANSSVWCQIFADVVGIPFEIVSDAELGAKGSVMAAGIAAGIYADYKDAAEKCVTITETVYPNPEKVSVYGKKYNKYKTIVNSLDNVWETLGDNNA